MAFQPDPVVDGLYFPSSAPALGGGYYSPTGLVETPPGSDLYAFEIGDYAYPSLVPVPHVELTIFTLDPATVTITVYRTAAKRSMPVPGQIRVYAVGGRNVVDWEAPFGIPLSYMAEQFDENGNTLGFTQPFTTQLNSDRTFVQNVFDPANAVPVTMAGSAAGSLKRPTPTNVYYPAGSGVGVAISGQRQGLTDVDASFITFDTVTAAKVRDMFGDPYTSPSVPPVLCIRTANGDRMGYPQPFYALIADPDEQPLDAGTGGTLVLWQCSATEIARPAPALVGTVLTYEDFDFTYPDTYESEDAAYSTYLEADRDYSIAGTAGEQD